MANKNSKTFKPGQTAVTSGQYGVLGPRGADLHKEVTVTKKEPFPPTQKPGQKYYLADPTKHK